ncbi:twin-arginine translocase TatA/TatE family subunit [Halobacteriales archaeon QS_1_68_17]|nr:MAG: twin-arginine translocase TatA/TatE family subunit [Halobacteriales archaeon QS_1_68_17]
MAGIIPLFPGIPGGPELLVILLIAILLFGANKIPKLARSSGQAIGEFQKGREEIEQELDEIKEGPDAEGSESGETTTEDTLSGSSQETELESDRN